MAEQIPLIDNVIVPQKFPGGYFWPVRFRLPNPAGADVCDMIPQRLQTVGVRFRLPNPAGADGWVVQELFFSMARWQGRRPISQNFHYWEAWPVARGATRVHTYQQTFPQFLGTLGLGAVARSMPAMPWHGTPFNDIFFHAYPAGSHGKLTTLSSARFFEMTLPADFIANNPQTQAQSLRSTATKPGFWSAPGAYRVLQYAWDYRRRRTPADASMDTRYVLSGTVFGGAGQGRQS